MILPILSLILYILGSTDDSWADIQNPDGNTCETASACNGQLEDSSGATIDTSAFTVDFKMDDSSKLCVKVKKDGGKLEKESCSSEKVPICDMQCASRSL